MLKKKKGKISYKKGDIKKTLCWPTTPTLAGHTEFCYMWSYGCYSTYTSMFGMGIRWSTGPSIIRPSWKKIKESPSQPPGSPVLFFPELLSKFTQTPDTLVVEWKANAFLYAVKWVAVKIQDVHPMTHFNQFSLYWLTLNPHPGLHALNKYRLIGIWITAQVKVLMK